MKSLEILENQNIANIFLDVAEEFIKEITNGVKVNKEIKEDIQIICNIISEVGSRVADKMQESLLPIKKDLEVLEIIIKKNVDIKGLKHTLKGFYKTMEEVLFSYNLYFKAKDEEDLTLEELLKLKKWLEEIQNETK